MIHGPTSRRTVAVQLIKRPLLVFLVAALALAALAVAERRSTSPFHGSDIARRSAAGQFHSLFASQPASPASPVALPAIEQARSSAPGAALAPQIPQVSSPSQALATAGEVANSAITQTQAATASAIAAQHFPPFVSAIVCPILLQARAQVISTIDALIAAFPALAPQLNAVKASALATIDAQLVQFHCPIS